LDKSRANTQALWDGDIPSFQMEKKYLRKDGTVIDAFLSATLVYDVGRQPLFAVAMVNDITERLKIERELANTKVLLQSAIEQTPVPMALASAPGGIVRIVNPACFECLGAEPEPSPVGQLIGTVSPIKWPDFESEGRRVPLTESPLALALQGITTKGKEMVALRRDGTRRWLMASAGPIYNDAGELIAGLVVLSDITERKQAEEALQAEWALLAQRVEERTAELRAANVELGRAVRLKDEFLANMSHELRTPLNAILGLSESLQEQVYGPLSEKQRLTLHTIEGSGRHLLSLINDILDLSKIGANKLELQVGWTSAESVCQASLAFIKQSAHKKKIGISYTFDNAVTVIQADERRLKQILVNLLGNAVKFTPEGGKVGLEVVGDAERQVLDLTVWDTGIGIRQEDRARLFQPFVQVDAGLSRQYSGTGLGLALVQQLTEMHGGSVKVESEVGKGSRFTVSLPWREPREGAKRESNKATQKEDVSAPPGSPVSSSSRPVKVLVAEDNEEGLYTLTEYLLARGYRVIEARNGMEAIEQAGTERPAVIVMDIQMPGMDGLEAIRRIRADADLWTTPIIALTALAMPGDRERCLEAGANEYLSKPVSMKELVTAIETQVQRTGDPTAD
jgi:PAS domain S-box-containing protein